MNFMKLFAKECSNNDKELCEAIKKMNDQIKKNGGKFTFDFGIDSEGWFARCKEYGGIMTGGTSKNPTEEEVMQSLVDAIKTAFHIPITKLEIKKQEEQCAFPTIKIIREVQFA